MAHNPRPSIGPSMPPCMVSSSSSAAAESSPSIGPSLPPHLLAYLSNSSATEALQEEATLIIRDTDDFDVAATPSEAAREVKLGQAALAFLEREKRIRDKAKQPVAAPKRPDWMLKPPSPKSYQAILAANPAMALKSRGFAQGGRIQSSRAVGGQVDDGSLWTETPAEREQRLKEEELGVRGRKTLGEDQTILDPAAERARLKEREREEQIRNAIREHDPSRGTSLLDMHRKKRIEESKGSSSSSSKDKGKDRNRERERSSKPQRSSSHRRRHSSDDECSEHDEEDRRRHRRKRRSEKDDEEDSRRKSRSRSPVASRDRDKQKEKRRSRSRSPRRSQKDDKPRSSKIRRRSRSRSRSRSLTSGSEAGANEERRRERRERKAARKAQRKAHKAKVAKRTEREAQTGQGGAKTMIWDRESAMGVGGKMMDDKQRAGMIREAASLADKFGNAGKRFL